MKQKYKIAIMGIGGVGGYIGGKLAAHYMSSSDIEIIFIARGENAKAIRSSGLKLITAAGEQTTYPSLITSQPEQIGVIDLLICCIKSYDLETSIEQVKPCINDHTIILPLLNGVNASETIRAILPGAQVLDGCMYIISRLIAPGIVKESGNINALYFGSSEISNEKLEHIETIFTTASINAHVSGTIVQTVWEKFLFISPLATLTSYFNLCIGEILINKDDEELLQNLHTEIKSIADAKGISLNDDIMVITLKKIKSLPYGTTSSMHTDFVKGNKTELNSLTAYVVEAGKALHIPTPYYNLMLQKLNKQ